MCTVKINLKNMRPPTCLLQPVQFLVTSNFKIQLLIYGEIVATKTLKVNQRWVVIEETANYRMIPRTDFVVYAVHNNTLIKARDSFHIQHLPNFVNLTLSRIEMGPREKLKISVKSHPGSRIGLLAMDNSVATDILAPQNDITRDAVFEELAASLRSFNQEESGLTMLTNLPIPPNPFLIGFTLPGDRYYDDYQRTTEWYTRQNYADSWLWSDMASVDSNGLTFSSTVPESITDWQINAFSISSTHGFGLLDVPVSLNVLKRFFVTVNLAYSILKTEIAVVEVLVFNYLDTEQETKLTLSNQRKEFYFVDHQNQTSDKLEEIVTITIPANNVKEVRFMLKPRSTGELAILVKAETPTATDTVRKSLRVTSGGLQYYHNIARFIDVESSSQNFRQLQLIIPRIATRGPENITFSVEGNLLGPALTNLGHLIRLPSDSGEQNMLNLVSSLIVLDYLGSSGTLDETTKQKAINYVEKGYQSQLKYKLNDGSFSVFGQNDGYIPSDRDDVSTNMVIMEILFPSGYVLADETRTNLKTVEKVQEFEEIRNGTLLILYLAPFSTEESVCVNVTGFRKALVLGQIVGSTKMYDYYDSTREAIKYFNTGNDNNENEI
ncbi:CD109 antigen-like [Wyeomyia smithii]|uniref:CD109 antigen-like n=1 Tax=Wyeomyia smithii TaxID=174621 RepID=UPI002467B3DC|nr:CD109 antigen-like [Wyeomyia smithii]